MAAKRDLLQAYQFLSQRVVSALVARESDPEQPPFRRPGGAAFGSIAVAVISLAAVGVYGVVVPGGNKAWEDGQAVIVEQETGTRYVYLDGHLDPVLNYASALLALGQHADTRAVSRNSLADVPRGPVIGIPGAPDSLPAADHLATAGWTLCTQPATGTTGSTVDETELFVGATPGGGTPLTDRAALVDVPSTGEQYLLWHGYRHRIGESDTVAVGLALRTEPHSRISPSLLDVIPAGAPVAPIPVPDAGKPSTAVPRRSDIRAGQLLTATTSTGATQHYLAQTDHLVPITELQYDIQLAYQPTTTAYRGTDPTGIALGLAAAAEASKTAVPDAGPDAAPATRPTFTPGGPLCATFLPDNPVPVFTTSPALPAPDPQLATPRQTAAGTPLADRVQVRPGWAALAEAMPSADAPTGTLVLITDQGKAYPLATPETQATLGYAGATPTRIPAGLVARIPQGPGLDPTTALAT